MHFKYSAVALAARAYELYPRGILSTHPLYEASEEYGRLVAARKKAGADGERWSALLERIGSRFPECCMQNQSLHLPTGSMDAAYAAWLWLPETILTPEERYRTVCFLASFVIPSYVIYSARVVRLGPVTPHPSNAQGCNARPEAVPASANSDRNSQVEQDGVHYVTYVGSLSEPAPPSLRRDIRFDLAPDEYPYAQVIASEIEAAFPGHSPMPAEVGQFVIPDVDAKRDLMRTSTLYDCFFTNDG